MLFRSLLTAALAASALAVATPDVAAEPLAAAHPVAARELVAAEPLGDAHVAARDATPDVYERQLSKDRCDPGYVECPNDKSKCAKVGYVCCPGWSGAEAMGIPATMAFAAAAGAYLL
ncbi:hypothetical protein Q8F55_008943 [Vanrija albida]|uniref:Granulins domain-containing protein n=1 Tax=Vanrija albida TaxID=181172 RepID=A0ABR3PSJ5_9TREE